MKRLIIIIFSTVALYNFCAGQTFKVTYDPSYKTDAGYGFYSDFEFVVSGFDDRQKATVVQLSSVKVNLEKGWYKKNYGVKAKFYPCSQLKGLCASSEVKSFTILIDWEYAGKMYQNGKQFEGRQRGDKFNFINEKNYFIPPSEISSSERSKAIIKSITIASCSYTTSNEIDVIAK